LTEFNGLVKKARVFPINVIECGNERSRGGGEEGGEEGREEKGVRIGRGRRSRGEEAGRGDNAESGKER